MVKNIITIVLLVIAFSARSQVTGSFVVKGDIDKYYPVVFTDGGWFNNVATEITIGRSSVHTDDNWRGAVIAKFRYHVTNWGHGADFIDVDLKQRAQGPVVINNFVGGWVDITPGNTNNQIVVWLRGGSNTYWYNANYSVNPVVFDGIQNGLPLQPLNFAPLTFKTAPDNYVTVNGQTVSGDILSQGYISAKKLKVTQNGWADYVFDSTYNLPHLDSVAAFVKINRHLPGIPSAEEIEQKGLDLGEMVKQQQVKIEELTLYLLELEKRI
jgi:hypothetical protein